MIMDAAHQLFEEHLHTLWQRYIEQLAKTIVELDEYVQRLHAEHHDSDLLAELRHVAHGLSGSGSTYGFTAVSEAAGRLDRFLQAQIENGTVLTAAQCDYTLALVSDLRITLADVQRTPATAMSAPPSLAAQPTAAPNQHIAVCDSDLASAEDIARQIANFGYSVSTHTDQAELQHTVAALNPAAIICDLAFAKENNAPASSVAPLIFTAPRDDFATRLNAVRAGGSAFFTKPIDIGALIDTLDTLTSAREVEPFRILIVDDQPLLAATYATTLRQAGMVVTTVTNPLRVMASLSDFQPDVLLLDMYMPGCTGLELATVLRQQAAYVSIPIVFLSAETQIDRQMDALKRGGDDFLTKPIQLDHLVGAVTSRANRARLLRSAMVRDSLTGLYNHTTTKEHLKRELTRATRQNRPLTFVMIDIDRFKSVNDTYGHGVGDHVIKSLARLLQQRLRKSDIIGRYGGEEFAVVLSDADHDAAYKLMDELRERFSQVRQYAEDEQFTVTFSCGISSFPAFGDATSLAGAADRALYKAKRSGRNCVVAADTGEAE